MRGPTASLGENALRSSLAAGHRWSRCIGITLTWTPTQTQKHHNAILAILRFCRKSTRVRQVNDGARCCTRRTGPRRAPRGAAPARQTRALPHLWRATCADRLAASSAAPLSAPCCAPPAALSASAPRAPPAPWAAVQPAAAARASAVRRAAADADERSRRPMKCVSSGQAAWLSAIAWCVS